MAESHRVFEQKESVTFTKEECCALLHAFTKNKEAMSVLIEAFGDTVKLSADILLNTQSIMIPDDKNVFAIYTQIAKAELSRKAKDDELCYCNHTFGEHQKALYSVLGKIDKLAN